MGVPKMTDLIEVLIEFFSWLLPGKHKGKKYKHLYIVALLLLLIVLVISVYRLIVL